MHDYLRLIRRYWISITTTLLLVVAVAVGGTLLQHRTWTASAAIFVAVESGGTAGELSQGATYAERQVKSFVEVAQSSHVLQPVIDQLGLETTPGELAKDMTFSAPVNTSVIEIAVESESPKRSADIANATVDSLARTIDGLSPKGTSGKQRLVQATVIQPATPPTNPTSPKPLQNLALGLLIGALLGLGQALLRDRLDTRIRTTADLSEVTDEPVLGAIANYGKTPDDAATGYSPTDEAFRTLRTNLAFTGLAGQRRRSLVITSALAGEGKTETAIRLAEALASAGERVLLVDADLRRPQLADRLGLEGAVGLSHVLSGQAPSAELIQPGRVKGVQVLPAGQTPPNPAELLSSDAMRRLVREVEADYDYVILDAPPLLPVTDAAALSSLTGGALVVARSGAVSRHEVAAALASVTAAGGDVLGIVLNDVTRGASGGSYAGHYYYDRTQAVPMRAIESPAPTVHASAAKVDHGW